MSETTVTRPVGVDELRRAWHALQEGQFRTRAPRPPQAPSARRPEVPASAWKPTEPVLPVIGCVGKAGATTAAPPIQASESIAAMTSALPTTK